MTAGPTLSEGERRILDRVQSAFPVAEDPYDRLAEQVGLSRNETHGAVSRLRRVGVIRRIGGSYVPARLGYVTSLVAAEVEPPHLDEAAARASRFPAVTHNYERDDPLNLWFTVIAPNQGYLQSVVSCVAAARGVRRIHALPALKAFKLRVDFAFSDSRPTPPQAAPPETATPRPCRLDALDKRLIRRTCGDIGTGLAPYDALAEELGMDRKDLLRRLAEYGKRKAMRRFGAILRHRTAGFMANGMAVLNVPDGQVDAVGTRLAARPEITHCYIRPRLPGWPYNLYAMIHASENGQVQIMAEALAHENGVKHFRTLFSCREFKKTSMVYFGRA